MKNSGRFIFLFLFFSVIHAQERPNILLMMTDDVGMEWFGCYGNAKKLTPHLDQLAETGVRFEHCYSQPICTPSRVKIMTGRYGFRNYRGFGHLPKSEITFANLLQDVGYKTCVVGKWQLAEYPSKNVKGGKGMIPLEAGFEEHSCWSLNDRGNRYWDPLIETNGEIKKHNGAYGPDVVSDFAMDFMTRNKDVPFFCYYPMILTHSPHVPTPDSLDPNSKDEQQNLEDMVQYTDKIVGKLVTHLKNLGIYENTLILFTSDNGTSQSIEAEMIDGRVLKGGKGSMQDKGTHVPLIAHWNQAVQENAVVQDLVDFSDFLPTFVEVAGAKIPADRVIDGYSFAPQLKGLEGKVRDWAYCNYWYAGRTKKGERHWVRNHRYKLYENGDFFNVLEDRDENSPIEEGSSVEFVQTQFNKLQKVFENFDHKIDLTIDYSKQKLYRNQWKKSRNQILSQMPENKRIQELIARVQELNKQKLELAKRNSKLSGDNEKKLLKFIQSKKFNKNTEVEELNARIDAANDEIDSVCIEKSPEFKKLHDLLKNFSGLGKEGVGDA